MPLDEEYYFRIDGSNADLCNVRLYLLRPSNTNSYTKIQTGGRSAGSCTAALFLSNFPTAKQENWVHVDIAGTMEVTRSSPYLEKGMSGRSVAGLIEYLRVLSAA